MEAVTMVSDAAVANSYTVPKGKKFRNFVRRSLLVIEASNEDYSKPSDEALATRKKWSVDEFASASSAISAISDGFDPLTAEQLGV